MFNHLKNCKIYSGHDCSCWYERIFMKDEKKDEKKEEAPCNHAG